MIPCYSQASLKSICAYEITSLLVQEYVEWLNSLLVRNEESNLGDSHKGIAGNDLADEFTHSAAASRTDPALQLPIP